MPQGKEPVFLCELQLDALIAHIADLLKTEIKEAKEQGREPWAEKHPVEYRRQMILNIATKKNAAGMREITENYIREQNGITLDGLQREAITHLVDSLLKVQIAEEKKSGKESVTEQQPDQYRTMMYATIVHKGSLPVIQEITQRYQYNKLAEKSAAPSETLQLPPLPVQKHSHTQAPGYSRIKKGISGH